MKYFLAHWRGEQGLWRSCLLNGVGFYVLAAVATAILSALISSTAIALGVQGEAKEMTNKIVVYTSIADAVVLLPLGIWACVGIFRCGARNVSNKLNSAAQRIGGATAIAWAFLIVFSTFKGTINLLHFIK